SSCWRNRSCSPGAGGAGSTPYCAGDGCDALLGSSRRGRVAMSRMPYFEVDSATGKHAEFLGKLAPHLNIFRMLAHSETGLKGFVRMGNGLLFRAELEPALRELAILRVGRLSRAAYEVFQHERIGREAGLPEEKIAALRDGTIEAPAFSDHDRAV